MRAFWHGHPVVLPKLIDAAARRWAGVAPRIRFVVIIAATSAVLLASHARVLVAEARWGGTPVEAWVATRDAGVGETPDLRRVRLPPRALPAAPVTSLDPDATLAIALPEGAVLTERHVSPAGPAAGLPAGARLVPVPVDDGWAVTAGGRVDVWIAHPVAATAATSPEADLVARDRPVVDVRTDESGDLTALVSIDAGDVPDVTTGLLEGSVILSHTPG